MSEVVQQTKKNPNDPNVDDINPELVKLARRLGFVKQPFNLFLHGDLTWTEALETMVLLVSKEYVEQRNILVQTLSEQGPSFSLAYSSNGELARALPDRPLPDPREVGQPVSGGETAP